MFNKVFECYYNVLSTTVYTIQYNIMLGFAALLDNYWKINEITIICKNS